MLKWISLGLMLMPTATLAADESKSKVKEYTIESNEPPTPSEPLVERTPFFAEPSAANEAQEEVEELKDEVKKLNARVTELEKASQKK